MFYVPKPQSKNECLYNTTEEKQKTNENENLPEDYSYELELLKIQENDPKLMVDYALAGNLRNSKIRSIHWRILLHVIPHLKSQWQEAITNSRKTYDTIKTEICIDPHFTECEPDDNPLSLNTKSVWYRYFCDNELRKVISQDVVRTSPEKHFFQSSYIQNIMINILFLYARQNPDICYRQGMHEILALILLLIHDDCETYEKQQTYENDSELLKFVLDDHYLEHDAYSLFCTIMNNMKRFYESDNKSIPNDYGHFQNDFSMGTLDTNGITSLINVAITNILTVWDKELYDYLVKIKIPFTAFGIRWLRLLFSREFTFGDVCLLWDAIFVTNSANFCLVDYILTAMLVSIRSKLLNHDYVECLHHLMKYPKIDVGHIVKLAIYFKDPTVYPKPFIFDFNESFGRIVKSTNFKNTVVSSRHQSKRKSKLNVMSSKLESKEIKTDEYSTRSVESIIKEVKHLRIVLSLCKIKLGQYHEILSSSVSPDDLRAQHSLTGIQELCSFLETDLSIDNSVNKTTAIGKTNGSRKMSFPHANDVSSHATDDLVTLCLPPPKSDIDMTLFRRFEYKCNDVNHFLSAFPHNPNNEE